MKKQMCAKITQYCFLSWDTCTFRYALPALVSPRKDLFIGRCPPLSLPAPDNEYKRPGEIPLLVFWSHVWISGNTQPKSIDTLYLAGRQVFTVEMIGKRAKAIRTRLIRKNVLWIVIPSLYI